MDPAVIAAIVAAVAAVAGVPLAAVFSHRSAMATVRRQVQQTQFSEILKKRMEVYPELWRIHIRYETNWDLAQKPKTGAWAREYVDALNELNLNAGVFFSQGLYEQFFDLRSELMEAARETPPDQIVAPDRAARIRSIVYGASGRPGMSTVEKDDLGSYRSIELQRRREEER
jgi:hypothetical protein